MNYESVAKPSLFGNLIPISILIIALCCLATGGIFVRLSELGPVTTGFYRALFAIPLAYFWVKLEKGTNLGDEKLSKPHFVAILGGVFLGVDLALWHTSFFMTTVANANLLANLMPFILVPLNLMLFKIAPSRLFVYGLGFASVGLILLVGGKAEFTEKSLFGDSLALMTALFYALYLLIIGKLRAKYTASSLMLWSSFGCALFLLPVSIILEDTIMISSISSLLILLSLALFSHIGGQGLLAVALGKVDLNLSSVLVLLQPLIAAIYAYLLFNETLTFLEVAGASVILIGIYLAKKGSE